MVAESLDLPPREAVSRYLRKEAILYVIADKIKAGLPMHYRLQLFDFVIPREETSWLLFAGEPNAAALNDLRAWERIFGPGFAAVVATVMDDEAPIFRTLDGDRVDLT